MAPGPFDMDDDARTVASRQWHKVPRRQPSGFLSAIKGLRRKESSSRSIRNNTPTILRSKISNPTSFQQLSSPSLGNLIPIPPPPMPPIGQGVHPERKRMRKRSKDFLTTPFKSERKPGEGYEWTLTSEERAAWDDFDRRGGGRDLRTAPLPPMQRMMQAGDRSMSLALHPVDHEDFRGFRTMPHSRSGLEGDFVSARTSHWGTSTPDNMCSLHFDPVLLEDALLAESLVRTTPPADATEPEPKSAATESPPSPQPQSNALSVVNQFTQAISNLSLSEKASVFRMLNAFVDVARIPDPPTSNPRRSTIGTSAPEVGRVASGAETIIRGSTATTAARDSSGSSTDGRQFDDSLEFPALDCQTPLPQMARAMPMGNGTRRAREVRLFRR